MSQAKPSIVVVSNSLYHSESLITWAADVLGCTIVEPALLPASADYALNFDEQGVSLLQTGKKAPGPLRVDFLSGAAQHRRKFGGGKGQLIAKAVGVKGRFTPHVVDLTAGLGGDSFVLASLGCRVDMLERSPVAFCLLKDGLHRAHTGIAANHHEDSETLRAILSNLSLTYCHAGEWLGASTEPLADVIYFDPMFPERSKSAQVNKAMQAFHSLIGHDDDAGVVLQRAMAAARYRVVVKRPRLAPAIGDESRFLDLDLPKPSHSVEGKTSRYDVYTRQKLPG